MQSSVQSSELRVTSRPQALALNHPIRARLLACCIPSERTLSDLADLMAEPLPKLHYHMERLLSVGLITITHYVPRAGRRIRYFRAIAASFVVSQELLTEEPGDRLKDQLRAALEKHRGEVAVRYSADSQGRLEKHLVRELPDKPPATMEIWHVLRLTSHQRNELAVDLAELFARYSQLEDGKDLVLAHAAFAPLSSTSMIA